MNEIINPQGLPFAGGQKRKLTQDHERKNPGEGEDGDEDEVSGKEFKNEESDNKSEEYLCEGKKEKVDSFAHGQAVDDENKKKVAVQQEEIHRKRENIQGGEEAKDSGAEKEKQRCTIAPVNIISEEEERDEVGAQASVVVTTDEQIQPAAGQISSLLRKKPKEIDGRGNIGREEDDKAYAPYAMASGGIDREEFTLGTTGKCLPVEEGGEASVKANVGAEEDEPTCPKASCVIVVNTYGSGEKKKVKFEFIAEQLKDNKLPIDACSKAIQEFVQESL